MCLVQMGSATVSVAVFGVPPNTLAIAETVTIQ
jgi:hypothetical protein